MPAFNKQIFLTFNMDFLHLRFSPPLNSLNEIEQINNHPWQVKNITLHIAYSLISVFKQLSVRQEPFLLTDVASLFPN